MLHLQEVVGGALNVLSDVMPVCRAIQSVRRMSISHVPRRRFNRCFACLAMEDGLPSMVVMVGRRHSCRQVA